MNASLHLASSSPRRAELLTALGLEFSQAGVDLDESTRPGEPAADFVVRLAREKAEAADRDAVIVAADTAVVLDDVIFGKPRDRDDALAMLARLSGEAHRVMTGVAVRRRDFVQTVLSVSEVRFRAIGAGEAGRYWETGEPADKAGAYAIQGFGGVFVESVAGSYSGVVGLPVFETARLLRDAGIEIF